MRQRFASPVGQEIAGGARGRASDHTYGPRKAHGDATGRTASGAGAGRSTAYVGGIPANVPDCVQQGQGSSCDVDAGRSSSGVDEGGMRFMPPVVQTSTHAGSPPRDSHSAWKNAGSNVATIVANTATRATWDRRRIARDMVPESTQGADTVLLVRAVPARRCDGGSVRPPPILRAATGATGARRSRTADRLDRCGQGHTLVARRRFALRPSGSVGRPSAGTASAARRRVAFEATRHPREVQ